MFKREGTPMKKTMSLVTILLTSIAILMSIACTVPTNGLARTANVSFTISSSALSASRSINGDFYRIDLVGTQKNLSMEFAPADLPTNPNNGARTAQITEVPFDDYEFTITYGTASPGYPDNIYSSVSGTLSMNQAEVVISVTMPMY
jgi:hypothetical protein